MGYDALTTTRLVAAARHLCAWARLSGRALDGAGDDLVRDFDEHECRCGGGRRGGPRSPRYGHRIDRFVRFLIDEGVLAPRPSDNRYVEHIAPYLDWLLKHRGLSEFTVRCHAKGLRQLLPVIGTEPSAWTAAGLRIAILDRRGREDRGALKRTVTVLRSWLRYHVAMGRCDPGLVVAVPAIADWKGHHLPRGLRPADVERLLGACDPAAPTGRRDRAILLLARLGLRAEDVRSLRFGQIDWRRGQIKLTGKGRRESRLPLPQEVGDALLARLEDGRPQVYDAHVFLRYAPPWRPFTEIGRDLEDRGARPRSGRAREHAVARCASAAPFGRLRHAGGRGEPGDHRHGAAPPLRLDDCQLRQGRHRPLRGIAQPWPEGRSC